MKIEINFSKFNPKVKDFLEKKPNLTILGLWWAWYWRLLTVIIGISVSLVIMLAVLSKLFE